MLLGYRAACLASPEKFAGPMPTSARRAQAGKKPNQTRSVPKSFEEGAGLCVFIGRIFMSAVTLLCADRPLPLYESGVRRVKTSSYGGYTVSLEASGFSVGEHAYYREAVGSVPDHEALPVRAGSAGHPGGRGGAEGLSGEAFAPGETVELWNLWVGTAPRGRGAFPAPWGMWSWTP